MKITTKSPMDHIHPKMEWAEFWNSLFSHEVFGIVFIALAIGAIVSILLTVREQNKVSIIVSGAAILSAVAWFITL
jgi:hypothetical protein